MTRAYLAGPGGGMVWQADYSKRESAMGVFCVSCRILTVMMARKLDKDADFGVMFDKTRGVGAQNDICSKGIYLAFSRLMVFFRTHGFQPPEICWDWLHRAIAGIIRHRDFALC